MRGNKWDKKVSKWFEPFRECARQMAQEIRENPDKWDKLLNTSQNKERKSETFFRETQISVKKILKDGSFNIEKKWLIYGNFQPPNIGETYFDDDGNQCEILDVEIKYS